MKFNKETILDPEIINIEGATLLLPEGWKRQLQLGRTAQHGLTAFTTLKNRGQLQKEEQQYEGRTIFHF